MADPLWTEAEARARAGELLAEYGRYPDILSPDEQALAMEVLRLQSELDTVAQRQYADVAYRACARFTHLVDPKPLSFMSEEPGDGFHLSVHLLAESLVDKWSAAIDELAAAVFKRGARTYFNELPSPAAVEFASGTSLPRLIVSYVPPAVTDDGRIVPGYREARFDVSGVSYDENAGAR